MEEAAPFFGVEDMSTEKVMERRQQAMEIFRQQKEAVEQRQRQEMMKQIREQEYEARALDAAKEEYVLTGISSPSNRDLPTLQFDIRSSRAIPSRVHHPKRSGNGLDERHRRQTSA